MHSNHWDGLSNRTRIFNYHSLPLSSSQKWPCCAIVLLRSKARGYPCPLDAEIFIQGIVLQKWTKQRQFLAASKDPVGKKRKPGWRERWGLQFVITTDSCAWRQIYPIPASPWGSWVLLCLARAVVTLIVTILACWQQAARAGCVLWLHLYLACWLESSLSDMWSAQQSQATVLWSPTRYSSLAAQVFN